MIEATLKVQPTRCWVYSLLETYPDAIISIMDYKTFSRPNTMQMLFEVTVPHSLIEEVAHYIQSNPNLREVEIITSNDGRIYGSVKTKQCLPNKLAEMSGCFIRYVTSRFDRSVEWSILGSQESFQRLLKKFEEEGITAEVIRISGFNNVKSLTSKQELFLRLAFQKGYFEYPKRVHLQDLADGLGITPAALTETLRKGVSKVLADYFGRDAVKAEAMRSPEATGLYQKLSEPRILRKMASP